MNSNLVLTREERRHLARKVVDFLASCPGTTAREIAGELTCSISQIHSVLVSLRAEGIVEAVDVVGGGPAAWLEYAWCLTHHGQFHGVREILPGIKRCEHCRKRFEEW
jgi:hypothetical protein